MSPQRQPNPRWEAVAARLRAQPGVWQELGGLTASSRTAYKVHIERGRLASFRPPGAFEAHVKGGRLFARYIDQALDRAEDGEGRTAS